MTNIRWHLSTLFIYAICATHCRAADATFDSAGVKIRYVTAGSGEAVVLIHGWMGDSSMWGRDVFGNTKLKQTEGFQAIAIDCRGHGKSDKPHEIEKYGVEMAADVVRLLDHLKIDKAHLIGYSSGSFIAGKVAAMNPDRVRSLVFGGQAPVISERIKPTDFSECEFFAKLVDEGKDLGEYLREVMPADKPKFTEEQASAIAKMLYGGKDVKAWALAGRSFKNLGVPEEQFKRFTGPIMFIHGGNESKHVKNRVAMVHQLLGRGEIKIIEGGDHISTLAKPEFGTAVVEFLQSHRSK